MIFSKTKVLLLVLLAATSSTWAEEARQALHQARRVIDLVERLERHYRELGPFQTTFVQRYESSTFGAEEEERGMIEAVPPGRMLITYTEPPGQEAVYDGQAWWLIDPEERTVTHRSRPPGQPDPLLDLLSGRADLLRIFAARPTPPSAAGEQGWVRLELIPREPRDEIDVLILVISPSSAALRRVEVLDPLGGRMIYRLGTPRKIPAPPPERFDVVVPEGYVVIEG